MEEKLINVNQVRILLEAYDSFADHWMQDDLKPLCEKAVNEYLAQGNKENLTPMELALAQDPKNRIQVIKMLRERTKCSLADAMLLVGAAMSLQSAEGPSQQTQDNSSQPS